MPESKTYTALNALPGVAIGKCSEILENRLQCWKAADFQITLPDGTTYQKCRRHAQAELQEDIAAAATTAVVDTTIPVVPEQPAFDKTPPSDVKAATVTK